MMSLFNLAPNLSPLNFAYRPLTDAKAAPDFFLAHLPAQRTDLPHFCRVEFRPWHFVAGPMSAVSNFVGRILSWESPAKIIGAVILPVVVAVGDLMLGRRRGAVECSTDKSMHGMSQPPAPTGDVEAYGVIALSMRKIGQYFPDVGAGSPCRAANAPKIADLVRPAFNGAPFFGRIRGRGFVSHGDLHSGRGGQGPASGATEPAPLFYQKTPGFPMLFASLRERMA